ncbi:MAG: hypothetical protein AAGC70_19020, partial [Pseudomonadota bacterium]
AKDPSLTVSVVKKVIIAIERDPRVFHNDRSLHDSVARKDLGGYSYPHAKDYVGWYTGVRQTLDCPEESLLRLLYQMWWDDSVPGLLFKEHHKYEGRNKRHDFSKDGTVGLHPRSSFVELRSDRRTPTKLLSLNSVHVDNRLCLYGLAQGVRDQKPSALVPYSRRICLVWQSRDLMASMFDLVGVVRRGDADFGELEKQLSRFEDAAVIPTSEVKGVE